MVRRARRHRAGGRWPTSWKAIEERRARENARRGDLLYSARGQRYGNRWDRRSQGWRNCNQGQTCEPRASNNGKEGKESDNSFQGAWGQTHKDEYGIASHRGGLFLTFIAR